MNDPTAAKTSPKRTINNANGNGLNKNPAPIVKSDPGKKRVHATVYDTTKRTAPIRLCSSMYLIKTGRYLLVKANSLLELFFTPPSETSKFLCVVRKVPEDIFAMVLDAEDGK